MAAESQQGGEVQVDASLVNPGKFQPYDPMTPYQAPAMPNPQPAMPSPLPQQGPEINGAVKQSGAIATVADSILRGFMQGRAYHQAKEVMQLKKKTDSLQFSHNQDAVRLLQLANAGYNSPDATPEQRKEYADADLARQGSWGALMDFYGNHIEQMTGEKKGKGKKNQQQRPPQAILTDPASTPYEKAQAWYQVSKQAGDPVVGKIAMLNTPRAQALRQAGDIGAQNAVTQATQQGQELTHRGVLQQAQSILDRYNAPPGTQPAGQPAGMPQPQGQPAAAQPQSWQPTAAPEPQQTPYAAGQPQPTAQPSGAGAPRVRNYASPDDTSGGLDLNNLRPAAPAFRRVFPAKAGFHLVTNPAEGQKIYYQSDSDPSDVRDAKTGLKYKGAVGTAAAQGQQPAPAATQPQFSAAPAPPAQTASTSTPAPPPAAPSSEARNGVTQEQYEWAQSVLNPPMRATKPGDEAQLAIDNLVRYKVAHPEYQFTENDKQIFRAGGVEMDPKSKIIVTDRGEIIIEHEDGSYEIKRGVQKAYEPRGGGSGDGSGAADKLYNKWNAIYKKAYPDMDSDERDALVRRKIVGAGQEQAGAIAHDAAVEPKQFDNDVITAAIEKLRTLPQWQNRKDANGEPFNLDDALTSLIYTKDIGNGETGWAYQPYSHKPSPTYKDKYPGDLTEPELKTLERDFQNQIRAVMSGPKETAIEPNSRLAATRRMYPLFSNTPPPPPPKNTGKTPPSPKAAGAPAPPASSQAAHGVLITVMTPDGPVYFKTKKEANDFKRDAGIK